MIRNHYALFSLWVLATATSLYAENALLRVQSPGSLPNDVRLRPPKDLNGYFPFAPAKSVEEWEVRAARLHRQMQVALGLWPMPAKVDGAATIHGRIDQGDYTIDKVYFQSLPNFYVTGNLYLPKKVTGKIPGVLCPHGHWSNGRFYDQGVTGVRNQIVQGAERFEVGGRSPLQARCVQLARMGCAVFHYDMLGYADSGQISFQVAHKFAKQRPEMNTIENWGLYSAQAEAHLQSVMGLQTLNSIRAVDFVSSLPFVDQDRLAVTGASGGGTQSFVLASLDPRIAVAFPAVMVSTAMQGGCTCENASLFRIGTGNVEMAALFAPKPLGLTGADDWTVEMATKGFPELQQHYKLYGAEDNVMLAPLIHFKHNYNYVSRAHMYRWFNKHLRLGHAEPIVEEDYPFLSAEQLSVWDDQHPRPESGDDFERRLLAQLTRETREKLDALAPHDEATLTAYREVVGTGIDTILGRNLPDPASLEYDQTDKVEIDSYLRMMGMLRNTEKKEELPILFFYPKQWEGHVVVWLQENGKGGLANADGKATTDVQQFLDRGVAVVGVDLLYQGEFLADGKPLAKTPKVGNEREFAGYTFGYNHSVFACRVHDVLAVINFVRHHDYQPEQVHLIGLDGITGPIAIAARAQARDAVAQLAANPHGFRFGKLLDYRDVRFLPGGAKYHDLPGMLAVAAPARTWIADKAADLSITRNAYQAAGSADGITIASPESKTADAVTWILRGIDAANQ